MEPYILGFLGITAGLKAVEKGAKFIVSKTETKADDKFIKKYVSPVIKWLGTVAKFVNYMEVGKKSLTIKKD